MVGVAKRRLLDLLTADPTSDWSCASASGSDSDDELQELELISPGALLEFFFFFLLLLRRSSSSCAAGIGMVFLETPEAREWPPCDLAMEPMKLPA